MGTNNSGTTDKILTSKRDWLKWMGGAALAPALATGSCQCGVGLGKRRGGGQYAERTGDKD